MKDTVTMDLSALRQLAGMEPLEASDTLKKLVLHEEMHLTLRFPQALDVNKVPCPFTETRLGVYFWQGDRSYRWVRFGHLLHVLRMGTYSEKDALHTVPADAGVGLNAPITALLEEVKTYIEEAEEAFESEWGNFRSVKELIEADRMPDVYNKVVASLNP